jgi:hypothetical protein
MADPRERLPRWRSKCDRRARRGVGAPPLDERARVVVEHRGTVGSDAVVEVLTASVPSIIADGEFPKPAFVLRDEAAQRRLRVGLQG